MLNFIGAQLQTPGMLLWNPYIVSLDAALTLSHQQVSDKGLLEKICSKGLHLPELNSVWLEAMVMERMHLLQLVLKQQSTLGRGILFGQFSKDSTQKFWEF